MIIPHLASPAELWPIGPGSCEVRSRRLLHSSAPHTPPQCDGNGRFLPVQCVFINTTTGTQLDLMTVFNKWLTCIAHLLLILTYVCWLTGVCLNVYFSFPEAFETFGAFRKLFPTVSSYCFCSDSRGRETPNTGTLTSATFLHLSQLWRLFSPYQTLKPFTEFSFEDYNLDANYDANSVLPVQGWNFSCLMCTTQHLLLIPLFAPLLRATSTESSRGGCWLFASLSLGASDVITALKLKQTSAFTDNNNTPFTTTLQCH